jgi:hypothetical protein
MLGGNVLLIKNFYYRQRLFDLGEIDYKIDIILPNAKSLLKNMAFIKDMDKINLTYHTNLHLMIVIYILLDLYTYHLVNLKLIG